MQHLLQGEQISHIDETVQQNTGALINEEVPTNSNDKNDGQP